MMDFMMPLMSVWICFMVPAAIGIYWIFKSIIGVGKQALLSLIMPIPKFTEAEYKAAEKEYRNSQKPEKLSSKNNARSGPKPGVRSLHHIDDEDFADTAPAALERKKEAERLESENKAQEGEKSSLIAPAPIKDDTRPAKESKKDKNKSEEAEEASESTDDGEKN
jgi:YidC/Oxa1 family membrane protein insertase